MQAVETLEHNGKTINIYQDEDPESPRDWDNTGVLVCFHRRYQLGDKDHGYYEADFTGWDDLRTTIIRNHNPVVILPLGLIDHSGISMYVGSEAHWCDPGGWDSGQVGFAFVSRATALKEWGNKRVTKRVRELAEKCLRGQIESYDQYLRGDVYGYTITGENEEPLDSCWGFFGIEQVKEAAKEAAA